MDLGKLVVGFVVFLIVYIGYTGQYIFYKYYEEISAQFVLLLIIYNVLVILLLHNYYLAVTTDPGKVPKGWAPDPNAPYLQVKKSNSKPRFCKTCKQYKPPRTHHCSSCERCVLKMDHHCPWLNNCVGYYNFGHFIRFIFYVNITTGISFYIFVRYLILLFDTTYYIKRYNSITSFDIFILVSNLVLCTPTFICVLFLSAYQFYSVCENTTTIENMEKDKVASLVKSGKLTEVKFPYDLGVIKNIKSVLGERVFLWLWPQEMKGDGVSFEIKLYEDEEGVVWPPPEYSHHKNKREGNY
ncbi:zf-DHHC-domain-containing protein [Neoconidiobolus thromboides FSU 785]|nr:zf-DHHC-domain-containing protein [Neoconidiobolus thromboides FSU 785]